MKSIALFIGFAISVLGLLLMWLPYRDLSDEEITNGKVIGWVRVDTPRSGPISYAVQVEFFDQKKISHVYVSPWSIHSPGMDSYGIGRAFTIGNSIHIAYNRDDPEINRLYNFTALFGIGWGVLGAGLFILWIVLGFTLGNFYLRWAHPITR